MWMPLGTKCLPKHPASMVPAHSDSIEEEALLPLHRDTTKLCLAPKRSSTSPPELLSFPCEHDTFVFIEPFTFRIIVVNIELSKKVKTLAILEEPIPAHAHSISC